uniref:Knottin scorpion toxin-like domain-containing protein n=1 Tax=Aegilops tauschii subsp. strangulata TaxID=200361 RepID=A0A453QJU7_AEGTS
MARPRNNTHILFLVVALLFMSTAFQACNADIDPPSWCTPEAVCQDPVTPGNRETCKSICKSFGYNPEQAYCNPDPTPRCCCIY